MLFHPDLVFYDVVDKLRSNEALYRTSAALVRGVDRIAADMRSGKGKASSSSNYVKLARAATMACGNNFGYLLSSYLPAYPAENPFSLVERPFMFAMTTFGPGTVVLKAGRQVGKCATGDTEVVTDKLGRVTLEQLFEAGTPIQTNRS